MNYRISPINTKHTQFEAKDFVKESEELMKEVDENLTILKRIYFILYIEVKVDNSYYYYYSNNNSHQTDVIDIKLL